MYLKIGQMRQFDENENEKKNMSIFYIGQNQVNLTGKTQKWEKVEKLKN